jgi:organic radical activating enzyme
VVITGGEPTIWDLDDLISGIERLPSKHAIQLETSGQNMLRGKKRPTWITWSPKANLNYDAPYELKALVNEVKWVVEPQLPWSLVMAQFIQFLTAFPRVPAFSFMPEGSPPKPENVILAMRFASLKPDQVNPANWRYSDRIQTRIGVR